MTRDEDVRTIVERVTIDLGQPGDWAKWPGGWPGDIESALIDSVFSARAQYRGKDGRGVLGRVKDWQARRDATRATRTLDALIHEIEASGPEEWAKKFGNSQVSPGRRTTAPGGPSKAATVLQAAHALRDGDLGVADASHISEVNVERVRTTLRQVPGIGVATSNYFLMLLEWPGVKPDRMIHRFLNRALGHPVTEGSVGDLLSEAARNLGVKPRDLEHAIWRWESDQAAAHTLQHAPTRGAKGD